MLLQGFYELQKKIGAYAFLVLFTSGCTTPAIFNRVNFKVGGSIEPVVKSEYSTTLDSGNLKIKNTYGKHFGLGYYGLYPGLNLELEGTLGGGRTEAFDDHVNLLTRFFVAEYFFNKEEKESPFFGIGIGSVGFSFGAEDVDDYASAWLIRGGWLWRLSDTCTLYSQLNYEKSKAVHVRRFFYFGQTGDVTMSSLGVEIGVFLNLF